MKVSLSTAKRDLLKLVEMIESNSEDQIIITRHGKPIVKMSVYNNASVDKRIGIAEGKLKTPKDLDKYDDKITKMFDDMSF